MAEAGLPEFKIEVWWGLLGPAGLPADIVKRLNAELNAVLGLPDVQESLYREGALQHPGTPEEFGNLIAGEFGRWKELIRDAHIQTN